MFQYIVENTVFNHPQYYFTTNICSFYRMYMYSFKLHMRKLGWLYHITFILFLLLLDDLSVGKIAIQSHTYPFPGSLYSANNALDRKTDTCTRTRVIGDRYQYNTVWWIVDLGRVHNVYTIDILFKNYDGDGMYTYSPNNRKILYTFYRLASL